MATDGENPKEQIQQAMAQNSQGVDEFVFKLMSSATAMDEQLAYLIWGSVVTSTRAYESVTININVDTQRVFVAVQLRWWARFERFDAIKEIWLRRAQERAAKYIPQGWRLLVYYERRAQGTTGGDRRLQDQADTGASTGADGDVGNGDLNVKTKSRKSRKNK
jgi:hypothetical protein